MKIKVHPDIAKRIAKELQVSHQTIRASLSYFNNSLKAQQIRQRAKEALIEEANNIIIKPKEEIN